jgi:drug/metabolite transporter (DMT)-like permease
VLPAALTTVLFSISAICGRKAAKLLGGTEANFWRLLFATLLLGIYAHGFSVGFATVAFPIFLLSGAIGFGVGDLALFQTLPRLGSRLSVMMVLCLSSPIGGLLEWWWLGTRLTGAEMFWGGVILAGVVLALAQREQAREWSAGILFGFVAAICQALGAVLSRKAFDHAAAAGEDINGITAAYQRVLGGVFVTAICLLIVKRTPIGKEQWRAAWPWVLLNGLSGPALGVSCYQWALKTTPTGVVLPIVAITPLVIIPFSHYFEGERATWRSVAGGVIAVAGAVALAINR